MIKEYSYPSLLFFFLLAAIVYYFVSRIVVQYYKYWFYYKQGIHMVRGCMPLVGNIPRFLKTIKKYNTNERPMNHIIAEDCGDKIPKIFTEFVADNPTIWVNDPNLLSDIYVTKNKYFDRHPMVHDTFKLMSKGSILFSRNNEEWAKRRKTLSTAFYKDKLMKMAELSKGVVASEVKRWHEQFSETGQPLDIVSELTVIQNNIILSCAFGQDLSYLKVHMKVNG
jgi:cytochrome P450